jgi:hypothetical protein
MKDKEEGIMAMYRESRPQDYVEEVDTTNYLVWTLLSFALGLVAWLLIALGNAENQRNALATKACQDQVFPAEIDRKCLSMVRTREHWWQHVYFGLTNLKSGK